MPLDEINKKFRESVSKQNKAEAIDAISKKEKVDIVKIIIEVLSDLEKVLLSSKPNKLNVANLKILKEYFVEVDRKVNANLLEKGWIYAKLDKKSVVEELKNVLLSVSGVSIFDDGIVLWNELAVWLHGLHQFTAKEVPDDQRQLFKKNRDAFVFLTKIPYDAEVFNKTGLTYYHLSYYYEEMAGVLDEKIAVNDKKLQSVLLEEPLKIVPMTTQTTTTVVLAPEVTVSSTPLIVETGDAAIMPSALPDQIAIKEILTQEEPVKEQEEEQEKEQVKAKPVGYELLENVTVYSKENEYIIVTRIKRDEESLLKFKFFMQDYFGNTLSDYLTSHPKTKDADKVSVLRTGLAKYSLTKYEEAIIMAHMGTMMAKINRYANGYRYGMMSNQHAAYAKKMVEEISAQEMVKEKILLFFKLIDGSDGLGSVTLMPYATEACAFLVDRLVDALTPCEHNMFKVNG